jgi:glycosyltransferase involved in cell wall biosynthesis
MKPQPIRVLVLANKPAGLAPGQRFRFEQWAPCLARDHDIHLDLLPFESPALARILYRPGHLLSKAGLVSLAFLRRARSLIAARNYDCVLVFREAALIGPAFYERLIVWSGKPIIFDFDDSIWSQAQEMNSGIFSRLHFFGKTRTLCRLASAVTPGNQFLADFARRYNNRVTVMPTSIELDEYPALPEAPDEGRFVVCWTGSTSTLANFEHAREPLERLAKIIPLTVKVICNAPPQRDIAGAEMRFVPWSAKNEAAEIADCHVGIMPLPDDEVSRGKCGLKALQYMGTGRPVVISAVGMNTDLVRDGVNGFLASSADDFVEALLKLAGNPELRAKIGAAGRRTVAKSYSAKAVAAKFAGVVRDVAGTMPAR